MPSIPDDRSSIAHLSVDTLLGLISRRRLFRRRIIIEGLRGVHKHNQDMPYIGCCRWLRDQWFVRLYGEEESIKKRDQSRKPFR
jgi:hypothetical protein